VLERGRTALDTQRSDFPTGALGRTYRANDAGVNLLLVEAHEEQRGGGLGGGESGRRQPQCESEFIHYNGNKTVKAGLSKTARNEWKGRGNSIFEVSDEKEKKKGIRKTMKDPRHWSGI